MATFFMIDPFDQRKSKNEHPMPDNKTTHAKCVIMPMTTHAITKMAVAKHRKVLDMPGSKILIIRYAKMGQGMEETKSNDFEGKGPSR